MALKGAFPDLFGIVCAKDVSVAAHLKFSSASMLCQILPKLIDNNRYVLLASAQDQTSSIVCKCEIIPTRIVILLRIN